MKRKNEEEDEKNKEKEKRKRKRNNKRKRERKRKGNMFLGRRKVRKQNLKTKTVGNFFGEESSGSKIY